MGRFLLLEVRLHDARWHGAPEWPPSPFRLFQALVAAAARGSVFGAAERAALEALERAPAPIVAVPRSRPGQAVKLYVPNNDLDTVGGDPARIGSIRAPKLVRPVLFETPGVFLVAWPADGLVDADVATLEQIAEKLYQFGRGVDMASAKAELVTAEGLDECLARHGGAVHRPSAGRDGAALRCPAPGSLGSLLARHQGLAARLKKPGELRQAAPARFRMVAYDCPPARLLFDLAAPVESGRRFRPWPLERCAELAARIRDLAAARLRGALPDRAAEIERLLVGRGAGEGDKALRPRIVPLPSIGMTHTDPSIRRVLVEVPPDCPIPADDLAWAFSGLDLGTDPETGEIVDERAVTLVRSDDTGMLRHYGLDGEGRDAAEGAAAPVWRTVTPVVLPIGRPVGRVGGAVRGERERTAAAAVGDALRHAGLHRAEVVRLQREPFTGRGTRADAFSTGTRFDAARLWHLEIELDEPVRAPLVIGDGRFVGLGLLAPAMPRRWRLAVEPEQPIPVTETLTFAEAVRAALMGRWRTEHGDALPAWLSGHDEDGGALREGAAAHLFVAPCDDDGDGRIDAVEITLPPGLPERDARDAGRLVRGLRVVVRNGARLATVAAVAAAAPSRALVWHSRTPYLLTRFPKGDDLKTFVAADLARECGRAGLPVPYLETLSQAPAGWTLRRGAPQFDRRGWLATLSFSVAIEGPFCLGRHRHFGMGAFEATE